MNQAKRMHTGSFYRVYTTDSQDYQRGRIPSVGTPIMTEDGRCYRFVSSDVDVDAGELVISQPCSAELAAKLAVALSNATEVIVEAAGVTANQYQYGYLVLSDATGVETQYVITKNSASDGADKVKLTLAEGLVSATTATDDCILRPSRFNDVLLGAALGDVVGAAVVTSTAGTSGKRNFFWVQTKGPGFVKVGTAAALTKGLAFIAGASGVVEVAAAVTDRILGYNVAEAAVSDGDITPVQLCVE